MANLLDFNMSCQHSSYESGCQSCNDADLQVAIRYAQDKVEEHAANSDQSVLKEAWQAWVSWYSQARDISSEVAMRSEEWAEALADFAPVGQPSLIAFDEADDHQPPHAIQLRNPAAIPATPDDDFLWPRGLESATRLHSMNSSRLAERLGEERTVMPLGTTMKPFPYREVGADTIRTERQYRECEKSYKEESRLPETKQWAVISKSREPSRTAELIAFYQANTAKSTTRPKSEPKTTEEREPDDADGEVEPANQRALNSGTRDVIGKNGTRTFAGLTNWLADPATDGIETPDYHTDLKSAIKRKGLTIPKPSNRKADAARPSNWSYQDILVRDIDIALND